MDTTKKIISIILRLIVIIYNFALSLILLLKIILSSNPPGLNQIPQIAVVLDKIIDISLLVIFVYGFFLLIKNNHRYLKLFTFSLPIYYFFSTLYRLIFITHGQFESADFSNLIIFLAPLVLIFIVSKLQPPQMDSTASPILQQANEPFSPLQYQGILVRGSANIIDQIIILIPFLVIIFLTKTEIDTSEKYLPIAGGAFMVYLTLTEAIWGQTVGKKLSGIKVMMQDGRNCTVMGAILRNVFRMIDLLCGGYVLAMIIMTITPKRQRIGDLIAKTVVVKS